MWRYDQKTGYLSHDGLFIGKGYSGSSAGKNNPMLQDVLNTGPIPRGRYLIGAPYLDGKTGPYTLSLTPNITNHMFGRSGFKIHGDSKLNPGNASEGCIVLPPNIRKAIRDSGDYSLIVV